MADAATSYSFDDTLERLKRERNAVGTTPPDAPTAPAPPPTAPDYSPLLKRGQDIATNFRTATKPLLNEYTRVSEQPVPIPPPPTLNPLPQKQPVEAIVNPMRDAGPLMLFLAAAGGALTQAPLTTGFKAASEYINGIRDGQFEKAKLAQQDFNDNLKVAIQTNTDKLDQYRAVMDNAQLSITEKTNRLRGIAFRYGAEQDLVLIDQGNLKMAFSSMQAQARANEMLLQHQDALNAQHERLVDSKWQLVQDPGSPDERGNPTTFLYNPVTKQSETLQGSPYTPKTVAKLSSPTTPLTADSIAYAGTIFRRTGVMPPMGMSASSGDRQKIINYASSSSPDDAHALVAISTQTQFKGGAASVKQLTTMLGATRQAVSQLEFNANAARQEMAKLGSTNLSPILNAIARGEEKWTGDPAYSSLFFYMNGVLNEAARIMSGGQASAAQLHQGAATEAQKWANINMTPDSFAAVVKSIEAEGTNRIGTFSDAIKKQQELIKTGTPTESAAPGPAPASPPKVQHGSSNW